MTYPLFPLTPLIVSEERMANEKPIATSLCRNMIMNGASIKAEYIGVLNNYEVNGNFNGLDKAMTTLCGNMATLDGGAIRSIESVTTIVDGNICF